MHKVLIRPLVPDDASISWAWRNDPEIWSYTGSKPDIYITPEIEHEWIIKVIAEENSARFAITVDDYYIGNIQLTDISNSDSAEYHIFIGDKSYWGKGIAHLATMQIIRYANEVLKLKKIFLKVNIEHLKAISLYKKCGFNKTITEGEYLHMTLDLANTPKPLLSVFLMTYNHEKYIAQALDGIIMQKTDFDFEIVVGEDCSTDFTRNIILKYQKTWPGKYKLLLQVKNVGAAENQNLILANCRGKYIALCEGDDYWTDPYKLQMQVDFLENNDDYSICFHDTEVVGEYKKNELDNNRIILNQEQTCYSFEDLLLLGNFMHTPSVVFRNKEQVPLINAVTGDYFLHLINARTGLIKRIPEVMSCYRLHQGGIFSQRKNWSLEKKIEFFLKQISAYDFLIKNYSFSKRHKIIVKLRVFELENNLRINYLIKKEYYKSILHSIKALRKATTFEKIGYKTFASLILNIFLPFILRNRFLKAKTSL